MILSHIRKIPYCTLYQTGVLIIVSLANLMAVGLNAQLTILEKNSIQAVFCDSLGRHFKDSFITTVLNPTHMNAVLSITRLNICCITAAQQQYQRFAILYEIMYYTLYDQLVRELLTSQITNKGVYPEKKQTDTIFMASLASESCSSSIGLAYYVCHIIFS